MRDATGEELQLWSVEVVTVLLAKRKLQQKKWEETVASHDSTAAASGGGHAAEGGGGGGAEHQEAPRVGGLEGESRHFRKADTSEAEQALRCFLLAPPLSFILKTLVFIERYA